MTLTDGSHFTRATCLSTTTLPFAYPLLQQFTPYAAHDITADSCDLQSFVQLRKKYEAIRSELFLY